jgi:hypothetical protein
MRFSDRKTAMSFPPHFSQSQVRHPPAHGAAGETPAAEPMDIDRPTVQHPGMPPPDVTDGQPASYGYANAAAMDWRADMPQLNAAWEAIERLEDRKVLASDFGAIDARNQLMSALGINRAEVDNLRHEDPEGRIRTKTVNAMRGFAASSKPDPKLLDSPHPPLDLMAVLAMLDSQYVRGSETSLPPIVTLLTLRHANAGDRYDAAVIARYSSAFAQLNKASGKADDSQYAATQDLRHTFVQDAARCQAAYRQLHADRSPPEVGHLSGAVQQALSQLADAYRVDMSLQQKTALVNTLEAAFGVSTEASDDISQVLEQLLRWYENPRPNVSPPPPAVLMGLVIATGWHDYQDEKSLRDGRTVKLTLTGHPALPDALRDALLHYLPAQPPSLSLLSDDTPPLAPDDLAAPNAAQLRKLLAVTPQPGPRRLAQMIERAIAQTGPPWLERLQQNHLAAAAMTAELQAAAASPEQREAIGQALAGLTDVMQVVVSSANPLYRAFMLDLYRSLGVAASDLSRAARLNAVFYKHPEISPAEALDLTERFSQRMSLHGYAGAQSAALVQTARQLRPHWDDGLKTRVLIEQAHDQSLDAVVESQVATAGHRTVLNPARLGVTSAPLQVAALVAQYGFTDEMLRKLGRDLADYQLYGSVDKCARIEAMYRKVLHPTGGAMTGTPMAAAIRRLSGAITTHLASAPTSITHEVSTVFTVGGGPGLVPPELFQLLRYFWRLDSNLPNGGPLAALHEGLDAVKHQRCVTAGGELDIARACEFNNATRENLVRALTERVPGFGVAYAAALGGAAGKGYEGVMEDMQAMLEAWAMPERSY